MIKKIKSLTKVFIKSFYQNLKIYNKQTKKLEKNSIFFWSIVILAIAIFYISDKMLEALVAEGQPSVFLNLYFLILFIFLLFQSILIATNVYFFSKDIEFILPMPVSSLELLFAKFNTMISMLYVTEGIFGIIPLIMYGIRAHVNLAYYILMFVVLLIFPILIVTVVSIIVIFLMKFAKYFKNKQFFQTVVTITLTICVLVSEILIMNNFSKIGEQNIEMLQSEQIDINIVQDAYSNLTKSFLIINPAIEILKKDFNLLNIIWNLLKLILYNAVAIIIFMIIGRKGYLKNILASAVQIKHIKNKKVKFKQKKEDKTRYIAYQYIKKEIKNIFKRPVFFLQTILPTIIIIISVINIATFIIPILDASFEGQTTIKETLNNMTFNMEGAWIILAILQFLYSISGLSLTAISRDGRDAIVMKYIPIDLYKQFVYKNTLQIFLNLLLSIVILGVTFYFISSIGIINIILLFIISLLVNLINSYLMVIVDLRRPNLTWDSEYTVIKKNQNKIFQYVLMILMILFFMYISRVFTDFGLNITISLISEMSIFLLIFIIIDVLVRKNKVKLFNKIN